MRKQLDATTVVPRRPAVACLAGLPSPSVLESWPAAFDNQAVGYAVVQVAGAVCGALLASAIDIGYSYGSWGVNHTGPGCGPVDVEAIHYVAIFVWEFLGTFVLVHRTAASPAARSAC